MDVNNYLNGIFPFFNSLNCEFSFSFRLIDNFSSHFSFHQANHKEKESKATYLCKLNNIFTNISLLPYPSCMFIFISTLLERQSTMLLIHYNWDQIIHSVQCISDSAIHLYQLQLIAIVKNLRVFFNKHLMNSIEFWNCPSNTKWFHYTLVDKDTKKFNLSLIFSCKALWDFNKIRKKNVTTSLKN